MGVNVLQVVGYQNSGKTTLISKLIQQVSGHGNSVGTIKHHGHGTPLALSDQGKDTEKHRQAGAIATCIEGNGNINITVKNAMKWQLSDLILLYQTFPLDFIIVEGFKKEKYPKIVMLRSCEDKHLIDECENIICIIIHDGEKWENSKIPIFHINEERTYLKWLSAYIRGQHSD